MKRSRYLLAGAIVLTSLLVMVPATAQTAYVGDSLPTVEGVVLAQTGGNVLGQSGGNVLAQTGAAPAASPRAAVGGLAFTGGDIIGLTAAALALVVAGVLLVGGARRRSLS